LAVRPLLFNHPGRHRTQSLDVRGLDNLTTIAKRSRVNQGHHAVQPVVKLALTIALACAVAIHAIAASRQVPAPAPAAELLAAAFGEFATDGRACQPKAAFTLK
jgi:hypothetical protein